MHKGGSGEREHLPIFLLRLQATAGSQGSASRLASDVCVITPTAILTGSAKPQFGFAPGFDPAAAPAGLARVTPLLRLAEAYGGTGRVAWRRVPVTIKDVAGLVPGGCL
jgi:hypothetical protein